jgi:hypothetical protein
MTSHARFPPVCVPPSPLVFTPSERLAVVCSVLAPLRSLPWPAPILPVPRAALTAAGRGSLLLGRDLAVVAPIGRTPQPR